MSVQGGSGHNRRAGIEIDRSTQASAVESIYTSLQSVLIVYPRLAIAVSGGVDSMTLAAIAFDTLGERVLLVHAMSPAVPADATQRVIDHATRYQWPLKCVDAGEFADERYRANPVNRCYFCKSNLYARLSDVWDGPIASGANLDDLGDYRPGLLAASEHRVVHPLIEANIDKAMVRQLAAYKGLTQIVDLPAQPCLSSRVQTGIAINATDLLFVHRIERYLMQVLGPGDIRCRITAQGVRVEVAKALQQAHSEQWPGIVLELERRVQQHERVLVEVVDYQRGSAFVHLPDTAAAP